MLSDMSSHLAAVVRASGLWVTRPRAQVRAESAGTAACPDCPLQIVVTAHVQETQALMAATAQRYLEAVARILEDAHATRD